MPIDVTPAAPEEVRPLRELYRQEMNCQIIRYSWYGRGWTDPYLLHLNGRVVGYGLVGGIGANPRDTIIELYVLPIHRGAALPLFRRLAETSRARTVETQTNDVLLTLMLYDCAESIEVDKVLFEDAFTTQLTVPGAAFRRITEADAERIFVHTSEPGGEWMIEAEGRVAATGGILFHYNVPYGDLFMEVAEPFQRRGYGSYLVQELKRTCYEMGRIPAARCNASNVASRAALQKAGLLPCARLLTGVLTR
ncbi:MAG TPA: GNAT family N-acetyltransferase [Thermoanaerobaculia bacterium]|nr:GNAT family N-acetyltransferase [Thermoanaerobaculia bacterium]